jgi:hypothetical protein
LCSCVSRYGRKMADRRLVTLVHDSGVVAVVRDARGRVWLGDPRPGTMLKDFEPSVQGLAGDVTLSGGLLPPEAVTAVVCDRAGRPHEATCANGAWVAVLPEPVRGERPLVRFLDESGQLVAVPLSPGVTLEPVSDAIVPCPVCRASDWARVVAAPRGRYGEDGAGHPTAAVCRRCGHEEALGVLFASHAADAPNPAGTAETQAWIARDMSAAARSVRFPLYGLVGHEPSVVGHGSHGQEVDQVTLAFETPAGSVTVETSAADPWESPDGLARQALEALLHERDSAWPEGSETAISLWLNARHRSHAADAAAAAAAERAVSVNGAPASFVTVGHGNRFAAVGNADHLTIIIAGHGDPRDLELTALEASTL